MTNLTGRPIYQKTPKPERAKRPMRKVSKKRAEHFASAEGKAEVEYMGHVKGLACVVCGKAGPNDAHHVYHGRYGGRKKSGFLTVPLCKIHHQDGPEAIHNGKEAWLMKYGPDYSYIKQTQDAIEGATTCRIPPKYRVK